MDFSSLSQNPLQFYNNSEERLYRVAGSACRVVKSTRRAEAVLEQQDSDISDDQLTILQQIVTVGVKVQEAACDWVSINSHPSVNFHESYMNNVCYLLLADERHVWRCCKGEWHVCS